MTATDILNVFQSLRPTDRAAAAVNGDSAVLQEEDLLVNGVTEGLVEIAAVAAHDGIELLKGVVSLKKRRRSLSSEDVQALPTAFLPAKAFSEQLVEKCLSKAARRQGSMTASDLRALPAGKARRDLIDDITVITVDLSIYTSNLEV